ncbi:CRISPR-associated protein, TM1812 family [Flexistipes sinusarabici DSM 4947]|uniref:CRISPR-associated protein, TM1812 family n=1 Tax=Flexistipes sinusarabici (strain ATCC 49648 / DSM 4947 / MAS 10) TaxID=717231 RepID=F8E950_FLESM|nr:TIGR02221 family CRISPR-associated protein [Flexistipes sinusarabici]AEI15252.1 CRISPR-associated protein, TM1812 family [Flexistipes sinusarabici DSM 4947]
MGRKVFLSFLGTGDYKNCNYYFDNQKIDNIIYIQEAVLRIFCKDWYKSDAGFVLTSSDAKNKHWQNLKNGLQDLPFSVEHVDIPTGSCENEIWDIFQTIIDIIKEDDEILIDITHGFRLMPVILSSAISYLESIKKVKIIGIYYGAFETLGTQSEVEKMPVEERNAPIFDLTPTFTIQKWAKAAEIFEETGSVKQIRNLSLIEVSSILKETKGKNQEAQKIKKVVSELYKFVNEIEACRSKETVTKNFQQLKTEINDLKELGVVKPLEGILEKIHKNVSNFQNDIFENSFAIIKWCISYGLVQQAYTFLSETVITFFTKLDYGFDKIWDRDIREKVSYSINSYFKDGANEENISNIKNSINWLSGTDKDEFYNKMDLLKKYRNDMNHCGYREDSLDYKKLTEKIKELNQYFYKILCKGE